MMDGTQEEANDFAGARERMVIQQIARRGIQDERVLAAMRKTPRHLFVPEHLHHMAYQDGPLPIGSGQTISQPYIVALMTDLLSLKGNERVLEIGVGSGYQTAVLAEMAREVIGLERIPELAEAASARLASLGYTNVTVHVGDGSAGYAESAPYDAILVAAAAPRAPEPLIAQLAEGGRLVLPIGNSFEQLLERIERCGEALHHERLIPVRFVPLIGRYGFSSGWR
jgi:protein-L-isoaspartate(D-aspartate) O-methyltransferase